MAGQDARAAEPADAGADAGADADAVAALDNPETPKRTARPRA